jgi:hypothetical protein
MSKHPRIRPWWILTRSATPWDARAHQGKTGKRADCILALKANQGTPRQDAGCLPSSKKPMTSGCDDRWGVDHDMANFAVNAIRRWWAPNAKPSISSAMNFTARGMIRSAPERSLGSGHIPTVPAFISCSAMVRYWRLDATLAVSDALPVKPAPMLKAHHRKPNPATVRASNSHSFPGR